MRRARPTGRSSASRAFLTGAPRTAPSRVSDGRRRFSSGPPTARTGAPGEITCVSCHNSFPLNSGPGALSLTGLPANYSPDQELALTLALVLGTGYTSGKFGESHSPQALA